MWASLPEVMPTGDLLPHMSARARRATIDAVMYNLGGEERITEWARSNDSNFEVFFKTWAKGEAKPETRGNVPQDGIETILARLDAGEAAQVVNGNLAGVDVDDV